MANNGTHTGLKLPRTGNHTLHDFSPLSLATYWFPFVAAMYIVFFSVYVNVIMALVLHGRGPAVNDALWMYDWWRTRPVTVLALAAVCKCGNHRKMRLQGQEDRMSAFQLFMRIFDICSGATSLVLILLSFSKGRKILAQSIIMCSLGLPYALISLSAILNHISSSRLGRVACLGSIVLCLIQFGGLLALLALSGSASYTWLLVVLNLQLIPLPLDFMINFVAMVWLAYGPRWLVVPMLFLSGTYSDNTALGWLLLPALPTSLGVGWLIYWCSYDREVGFKGNPVGTC